MISIDDCKGLCGLTDAEIAAIAEHEHLPEMVAVEAGAYLSQTGAGQEEIRRMIEEDIAAAQAASDPTRVLALRMVLHNFVCGHPATDRRHAIAVRVPERRQP
jgi:hypothetical protein